MKSALPLLSLVLGLCAPAMAASADPVQKAEEMVWTPVAGESTRFDGGAKTPTLAAANNGPVVMTQDGGKTTLDISFTGDLARLKDGANSLEESATPYARKITGLVDGKTISGSVSEEDVYEIGGMTLAFDGKRGALVASGRLTPENRKVASYLTALMLYSVTRR